MEKIRTAEAEGRTAIGATELLELAKKEIPGIRELPFYHKENVNIDLCRKMWMDGVRWKENQSNPWQINITLIIEELERTKNRLEKDVETKIDFEKVIYASSITTLKNVLKFIQSIPDEHASQFKPQWIDVKTRLPEHQNDIFIYNIETEQYGVGAYRPKVGWIVYGSTHYNATHWKEMDLPELPIATPKP